MKEQTHTPPPTLRERAYALRYDPDKAPPPDELCMMVGGIPIAARGNLSVVQGKSKAGKSAVFSAVLGAALRGEHAASGDTLCIDWQGESGGAVIHLDTEQSLGDWHALATNSVTRSGMPMPGRFISLPLVMFARSERLEILRQSLEHEQEQRGSVDAVIIDGIADLCKSPNDEAEALELVSEVHALAQEYRCAVFCGLHENPSATPETPKTRGHLGSELNRKAFANLRIDKDTETSVSTLYGTDMRKRDIPKSQGFCFAWDDEAHMHTFKGRAAGLEAAQREERKAAEEREYFAELFDSIGTNGHCPDCTPDELLEAHRDIIGTKNPPKRDAMKKRMQRAESLGVLRKPSRTTWTLNPSGQSGHERDN